MCGRFAFFQEIDPPLDDLGAVDLEDPRLRSRWNIPPTAPIHVVTESIDKETGEVLRALRVARWGLVAALREGRVLLLAHLQRPPRDRRREAQLPRRLGRYRAIVPMDGYYEWVRDEKGRRKRPYFIAPADGSSLYMAALVSWWKGPGVHEGPAATEDGAFLLSTTIITRAATGDLAGIHDRTPVMSRREEVDPWLDTAMDDRHAAAEWILDDAHLLEDATLEVREVDPAVGKVGNDGPESLEGPQRLL
ncbi:SOS response-associated peptidase [Brachybacterium sp. GPGPB12]|uniref:SOS response-associated peptidase n=1 Tax=Brachybacterium sp. GPGPB12 TaxID=3023517 RepID=UPI00313437DD